MSEPTAETEKQGSRSLGSTFMLIMMSSGGTILLALISGIITTRGLGPDGRGVTAMIQAWTLTLSWASALGFANAMVYYQSKGQARASTALGTVMSITPVLGLLGVIAGQLLIPVGMGHQTAETRHLAHIFLCGVPLILATEASWALLMANHRFQMLGAVRALQPFLYVVALVTCLALGRLTPTTVLASQALSYLLTAIVSYTSLARSIGLARPNLALVRKGIHYGLRLQGVVMGQLVTARLDLMMLPAFVTATAVGFYSVSVNVASMIMSLFGSLALVVFPVAAAQDENEAMRTVERGTRVTVYGGLFAILCIGVVAPWLLPFVYGSEFYGAVEPLWLLLPGVVMWATNSVLGAGLESCGRPGRASLAQVAGMIVTAAGLALTLPHWGIIAAAVVSSVAYSATCLATGWALHASSDYSIARALAPVHLVSDLGWFARRLPLEKARGLLPINRYDGRHRPRPLAEDNPDVETES